MLQALREKTTGWMAIVILGLLIIPFAFFGVENYFSSQAATYVAMVGEEEISQDQFRQRWDEYRGRMRNMMGEQFDPRQFEDPATKRRFLDQLIEEKLLEQAAEERGVVVPASQLQHEILQVEAFQVGGQFDAERYRLMLAAQNMNPRGFEQQLRRDMTVQTLPRQIVETGFVTEAYLDRYLQLRDQRRSFDYALLPSPPADAIGDIAEADVQAYYDANPQQFTREERVAVEYLRVATDDIEVPVEVDEQTLRQRYQEQRLRFVEPGARLASHILVQVPADADADAVQAAEQRASEIAEAARADGAGFAALAQEHSDDLGSKSAGGDLGWIEEGLLSPAFEDALFAMEEGEISDPVKTDEGWHVIQVREVREEKGKQFEDVVAELREEYLASERERQFSEVTGRLVDFVYRDPTTLETAAHALDLEIQRTGLFGRDGGEGIAADPALVEAAFSENVLVAGNVSDPVELADRSIAVVRLIEHEPARPMPFEDVRDRARAAVMAERIDAAARAQADAALEALRAGSTLAEVAGERGTTVESAESVGRNAANVESGIVRRAFQLQAPQEGASGAALAELSGGRYALVALRSVEQGDASAVDPAARTALRQQLGQAVASVEARAFIDALREQAKVAVFEERL